MPILKRAWFADLSPGRGYHLDADDETAPAKVYAEFQLVAFEAAAEYSACLGFCGSAFDLTDPIELSFNVVQGANGVVYSFGNGKFLGWGDPARPEHSVGAAHAINDWIGIAIDTPNGLSWVRNVTQAPTTWYGVSGAGTADPATGIEGFNFRTGTGLVGPIYLCAGAAQPGAANVSHPAVRLNAGATAFAGTLPTGFSAFNATTVFNAGDMAPNFALTEGGLLMTQTTQITGSGQPTAFVRSTKYRSQ